MIVEAIVDLATVETAEGSEVTERLVRLADRDGRGEWRREWRSGAEWCNCPLPEATARAIADRALAHHEPRAA